MGALFGTERVTAVQAHASACVTGAAFFHLGYLGSVEQQMGAFIVVGHLGHLGSIEQQMGAFVVVARRVLRPGSGCDPTEQERLGIRSLGSAGRCSSYLVFV